VSYLVEKYGWAKMEKLLLTFKDGATYDSSLKTVYGFDITGLEKEWRTSVGGFLILKRTGLL